MVYIYSHIEKNTKNYNICFQLKLYLFELFDFTGHAFE